jgi:hypothetical protein
MDSRRQLARWPREVALGALALAMLAGTSSSDPTLASAIHGVLPGLSPELVRQLVGEKMVLLPGGGNTPPGQPALVQALVLFGKPRSRVFHLLLQTARQIEYRPGLAKLETVERFPGGDVDVQQMRIMFMRISYWLRYQWDLSAGRISWKLDPRFPNDLRVTEGFWELHEVDGQHTVARFGTRVDVGSSLPAFLQKVATRENVATTLDRCRRWVDSDGTYRP